MTRPSIPTAPVSNTKRATTVARGPVTTARTRINSPWVTKGVSCLVIDDLGREGLGSAHLAMFVRDGFVSSSWFAEARDRHASTDVACQEAQHRCGRTDDAAPARSQPRCLGVIHRVDSAAAMPNARAALVILAR